MNNFTFNSKKEKAYSVLAMNMMNYNLLIWDMSLRIGIFIRLWKKTSISQILSVYPNVDLDNTPQKEVVNMDEIFWEQDDQHLCISCVTLSQRWSPNLSTVCFAIVLIFFKWFSSLFCNLSKYVWFCWVNKFQISINKELCVGYMKIEVPSCDTNVVTELPSFEKYSKMQ